MAQVRLELGRDAIILHSHKIRPRGWRGLFAKPMVEVTAATDDSPLQRADRAPSASARAGAAAAVQPALPPRAGTAPPAGRAGGADLAALAGEMAEMKALLTQAIWTQPHGSAAVPPAGRAVYERLQAAGVKPDLAAAVASRAVQAAGETAAEPAVLEEARRALAAVIGRGEPIAPRSRRHVVALVGPTGVGKTTTLAKLAARFALGEERSVALITADTYRIAAVEQLRTYADIIGVPVDVVFTAQELRQALARHSDRDLILIDTAGRSYKNAMQMSELRSLLEAAQPDETHLVVSLTTSLPDAEAIIERFSIAQYNRVLLTKLDESSVPGQIANVAAAAGQPLSYVSNGQSVPDDLETADGEQLAGLIVGG